MTERPFIAKASWEPKDDDKLRARCIGKRRCHDFGPTGAQSNGRSRTSIQSRTYLRRVAKRNRPDRPAALHLIRLKIHRALPRARNLRYHRPLPSGNDPRCRLAKARPAGQRRPAELTFVTI